MTENAAPSGSPRSLAPVLYATLAIAALVGWYLYFAETGNSAALEAESTGLQQEREDHQGQIAELTANIQSQAESLEQSRRNANRLETEVQRLDQERSGLEAELAQERQNREKIEQDLAWFQSQKSSLSDQVSAANEEKQQLQAELEQAQAKRQQLLGQIAQVSADVETRQAELSASQQDIDQLNQALSRSKQEQDQLNQQLAQTLQEQEQLTGELSQSRQAQDRLAGELAQSRQKQDGLTAELAQARQVQNQLATELTQARQGQDQLTSELELTRQARDQLVSELELTRQEQYLLKQRVAQLSEQQKKEAAQFAGMKQRLERELNESRVEISQLKNRMLVISLTSEVLFGSGSATIKPAGREVLSLIASTLNQYPDRLISIEGHTDNVPIAEGSFYQSNWELSTARSLAALNYLRAGDLVAPERLKVVGHGEHSPRASNDTAEGRQMNRRIEIRLLPSFLGETS